MADDRQYGSNATVNRGANYQVYRRALIQTRRLPVAFSSIARQSNEEEEGYTDQEEADGDAVEEEADWPEDNEGLEGEESLLAQEYAQDLASQEEATDLEEEQEDLEEVEEAEAMETGGPASSPAQREAVDRFKKEAVKESQGAVTRLASRLKIAKIGCALSLVGIIVTYLIMTGQFILGNWLQNPNVPKLSYGEIIIWTILTVLLVLAWLLGFALVVVAVIAGLGPLAAIGYFGQVLVDLIF